MHASCVARGSAGVLLLGASGAGKSDLVLRLLACGFSLVADDRVELCDAMARAPDALQGLLEVRGFGIVRLPFTRSVRLRLAVRLGRSAARLPVPVQLGEGPAAEAALPVVHVDPGAASATARVELALACALGHVTAVAGALEP